MPAFRPLRRTSLRVKEGDGGGRVRLMIASRAQNHGRSSVFM
jgi:hypothetical protein